MHHLKEIDKDEHTVIMVQVQNEVGILGDSRDRSPLANEIFVRNVPAELIAYLQENQAELSTDLYQRWEANDFRSEGNWENLFGSGVETDEIFMAWHYACYIDAVTQAGKADIPYQCLWNAWLSSLETVGAGSASGGHQPGEWPSGGPLPHTLDIWMAGAPSIDLFAP